MKTGPQRNRTLTTAALKLGRHFGRCAPRRCLGGYDDQPRYFVPDWKAGRGSARRRQPVTFISSSKESSRRRAVQQVQDFAVLLPRGRLRAWRRPLFGALALSWPGLPGREPGGWQRARDVARVESLLLGSAARRGRRAVAGVFYADVVILLSPSAGAYRGKDMDPFGGITRQICMEPEEAMEWRRTGNTRLRQMPRTRHKIRARSAWCQTHFPSDDRLIVLVPPLLPRRFRQLRRGNTTASRYGGLQAAGRQGLGPLEPGRRAFGLNRIQRGNGREK